MVLTLNTLKDTNMLMKLGSSKNKLKNTFCLILYEPKPVNNGCEDSVEQQNLIVA